MTHIFGHPAIAGFVIGLLTTVVFGFGLMLASWDHAAVIVTLSGQLICMVYVMACMLRYD